MENVQQKSVKKWFLLLILPIPALIVVLILQLIFRLVLNSTGVSDTGLEASGSQDFVELLINVVSMVVGVVSVILIVLFPLFLVLLVRDLKGHIRKKTTAVLLAVFFGYFSWIYTWEKNKNKFWINLALALFGFGIIGWLWAIIDNASKPSEFYQNYNQTLPTTSDQPSSVS